MSQTFALFVLTMLGAALWAGPPVKNQAPVRGQVDRTADSKREKELGDLPGPPRPAAAPMTKARPTTIPPGTPIPPPPPAAPTTPATPPAKPGEPAERGPHDYDDLPVKLPNQVEPVYPEEALRKEWQGRVLLHVWLDSQGGVMEVKVFETSGRRVLDDAAILAVRMWRYRPALIGGTAIPSEILVPVRFIIRDPS